MAFPTSPTNGQQYTNALGTVYQYTASSSKWNIVSQQVGVTGAQGVTGIIGIQGATGIATIPDPINFTVYDNGNSGSSLRISLVNGQKQKVSISASTTLYMSATGLSGAGTYTLKAYFAGAYTLGWTGINWPGGTIPYHSNASGATDIVNIYYDGTAFYGVGAIGFAYP